MGAVIHLYDDTDHLDVALDALEQARDFLGRYGGAARDIVRSTIDQLCAWIEFAEDDVDLTDLTHPDDDDLA